MGFYQSWGKTVLEERERGNRVGGDQTLKVRSRQAVGVESTGRLVP